MEYNVAKNMWTCGRCGNFGGNEEFTQRAGSFICGFCATKVAEEGVGMVFDAAMKAVDVLSAPSDAPTWDELWDDEEYVAQSLLWEMEMTEGYYEDEAAHWKKQAAYFEGMVIDLTVEAPETPSVVAGLLRGLRSVFSPVSPSEKTEALSGGVQ